MSTDMPNSAGGRTVTLEIDHRVVVVPEGVNVLRAAELHGIGVPSLCSHKDLSPFGGCRLCVVEIEGMRGYPLACSTIAAGGMKVQTSTVALREMRREFLQLILSEHPCSCLFCDERDECRRNQFTIRKAGVSTGCRSCSNDGDCELQRVVEQVGVTEMQYPVTYRGFDAEHDDPFFDRDYNLCILCGRCVRMCHEVRGTSVLAFQHRGSRTHVGPAYGRSHVEAGCEFCGACVSVCPTGTLTDKVSKWDGKADGAVRSTCPFCAIGCQVEIHHKGGRLSHVHAALDPEINDGQLCVRGRFCMPEVTHHPDRARKPMLRKGKYFREVDWTEALSDVAGRLHAVAPDDFLMVASPDLTNESLFAARRLVREALGSTGLDSTARAYLPGGLERWAALFALTVSTAEIERADTIVVAGLDSRFSFSVAGIRVRRALSHGTRLVVIDARESNLARCAAHWLRPAPGDEARLLAHLLQTVAAAHPPSATVAHTVAMGGRLALVLGPRVFEGAGSDAVVDAMIDLAAMRQITVLPLCHGANTRGVLELGVLDGMRPWIDDSRASAARTPATSLRMPRVLYLVGESPFLARPDCDYVIAQDLYLPPFEVDAFLPAASFVETDGTLTNIEGRVQRLAGVEPLTDSAANGCARPDWFVFSELAGHLDRADLQYESSATILEMIHEQIAAFPATADRRPRRMEPNGRANGEPLRLDVPAQSEPTPVGHGLTPVGHGFSRAAADDDGADFLLVLEHAGFRHRGIDTAAIVEGLGELKLEQALQMNPEDMERLGVEPGDAVVVAVDGVRQAIPVTRDEECPTGAVYFVHAEAFGGLRERSWEPIWRLPPGPTRVRLYR